MSHNLYLLLNNPDETTFVSADGIALYSVTTSKSRILGRPTTLRIRRPADDESDRVVAEVKWSKWPGMAPVVRSNVFDGKAQELQIGDFLYRQGNGGSHYSSTRYFLGNDKQVYRWRVEEGSEFVLTHDDSGTEVARFVRHLVRDGFFRGERKAFLQLQPSTLDPDMIVLTFIIMEKKRRDRAKGSGPGAHNEDLVDGSCEG